MKNIFLKSFVFIVLFLGGCSSVSTNEELKNETIAEVVGDETILEVSNLDQELKDKITYMYNEERLAYDVYLKISEIQPVQQLFNIATNSETEHINSVNTLAIKYDLNITIYPETTEPYNIGNYEMGTYSVPAIQDLYNQLYLKGIQSKKDALEVGCIVEVTDINDLDEYIDIAVGSSAPSDIINTFISLRNGSYNHYWTFNDALLNLGVVEGCCILGVEYCKTEADYPRNR